MGVATHCNRHQRTHGSTSIVRVAPEDVSIYCGVVIASVIAEALAIAGVIAGAVVIVRGSCLRGTSAGSNHRG